MLERLGINITGKNQAQTMNVIVEGKYRSGANISINLMKGQISNCSGVKGIRGGARISLY